MWPSETPLLSTGRELVIVIVVILSHVVIVLGQFCPRGTGALSLTLCKEPICSDKVGPQHWEIHALLFLMTVCIL